MKMDRRNLLAAILGFGGVVGIRRGAFCQTASYPLRVMKLRHSTFLLDVNDRRILIDPWFSRGAGVPIFAQAPQSPLLPEEIGRLDIMLVTASGPLTLDPRGIRQLYGQNTYCFVPDETAAKILRTRGYRRVRIVQPGDQWNILGIRVDVSHGRKGALGRAHVGYRLEADGKSIWHTGSLSSLKESAEVVAFARRFQTDILLAPYAHADEKRAQLYGMSWLSQSDIDFLMRTARARAVMAHQNDYRPLPWLEWVIRHAQPENTSPPGSIAPDPRFIHPDRGRWYAFSG